MSKFFSGVEDEDEDVASAPSSKSSPDEFVGFSRIASLLMMMVLLASRDRPTRPDRPGRSQEKFLRSLFKISSTHQKLMKNTKIKVYACLYQAVQYVSFNNIDYMSANVRGIYSLSLS